MVAIQVKPTRLRIHAFAFVIVDRRHTYCIYLQSVKLLNDKAIMIFAFIHQSDFINKQMHIYFEDHKYLLVKLLALHIFLIM